MILRSESDLAPFFVTSLQPFSTGREQHTDFDQQLFISEYVSSLVENYSIA
jgi:hypothetical protein